ncbi:MAG TPA: 3-isopropylmalate dehydrogenase [Lachnoclostridium phocaeense]|uniref:3-isopropylmalate dehydrogenase n=1 Tax=Lachnoclostridium phocaeense TaxID=1871021 RepID=A0A921I0E4_9FIRM|nr:3-isopropylmalate dehydrogenase [Lachnoclostridium phocaeense]
MSINDFYKVYAYACLYQSDTDRVMEVDPEEITLTFVCMRYPRKLLGHLKETRGIRVSRQGDGIYYLEGDALAMQLLVTGELSERDNYWLQHLRGDLKEGRELQDLMERYERHRHSKWYQAAMDLIVRANWDKMKEEKEMCEALRELFADELQESKAQGKEQGEETKLISLVCKKIRKNKAVSVIAEELEEPEEKISLICETARQFAPDYDADQIYAVLAKKEAGGVNKP